MELVYRLMYSEYARIQFAFWVGVGVVVLSLLLLVAILVMRQVASCLERRHERIASRWREVLLGAAASGVPQRLPPLGRWQTAGFVDAWNEVHGHASVAGNPGVVAVADAVDLEARLYMAIDHGGFHDRIMAIIATGYLGRKTHFDKLSRNLEDPSPIISLSSAHAMIRIDPELAVERVMPRIVARSDWTAGGVAAMLDDAAVRPVAESLSIHALRTNDPAAARMIRFLADVSPEDASRVIENFLKEPHDEHLVSTCLQVMSEPRQLEHVRPLLAHPRWHVRMHSAAAIGRLGDRADHASLVPLLSDAQWWVRYRAAQALSALLGRDPASLLGIRDGQQDRFARDILDHVLAELRLGVRT